MHAGEKAIVNELANQYGLDLFALRSTPAGAIPLRQQRIAVALDAAGRLMLQRFGFGFDVITAADLNAGKDLTTYDLFINNSIRKSSLSPTGQSRMTSYFAAGKDYIGLGSNGTRLVRSDEFNLFAFTTTSYPGALDSAIRVDYNMSDSVGSGFGQKDTALPTVR